MPAKVCFMKTFYFLMLCLLLIVHSSVTTGQTPRPHASEMQELSLVDLMNSASIYINTQVEAELSRRYQSATQAEQTVMVTEIENAIDEWNTGHINVLGHTIQRIFPEEESQRLREKAADRLFALYQEERAKPRSDTELLHLQTGLMGMFGAYALPYIQEMPWRASRGMNALARIGTPEALDMLFELYTMETSTERRQSEILFAIARNIDLHESPELLEFCREEWRELITYWDPQVPLLVLAAIRSSNDAAMLPFLREVQQALPSMHADAEANPNPFEHLSDMGVEWNQPNIVARFEENLLETIQHLERLDPEVQRAEAQQRRIEDIEKRLGVIDERLNQPDASQIPPLGAFAMRTATLIELELAKRDLPGSREVHEALHRKGQPQDAWPEYTEWPAVKRLQALQGLQEVLEKLHAEAAPEVASHTAAMLEVAASWLEEESKAE